MVDEGTDAELVALAQTGDRDAFGTLAERYGSVARRVAYRMVGHQDVSQDLAQEAVVQAYLSLNRLRDPARFQSWLYGIVLNVCRRHVRDRSAARTLSYESLSGGTLCGESPLIELEPGPQEVAEAREIAHVVREAVGMLSPRNRAATLMYYYGQLSVREIAAELGISATAVKGRLHKSRNALRELLEPLVGVTEGDQTDMPGDAHPMIKVSIADIVIREERDEETGQTTVQHIVVLKEDEGNRAVPLWIGKVEGQAIVMGLRDIETPRPMTYSFVADLLEAAGAELEEVRVEALQGDTFIGVAKVRAGGAFREIDARPSDCLALAVRTGAPVYVTEEVMDRAGVEVGADARPQGAGIAETADQLEAMSRERAARTPSSAEETEQAVREVVDQAFGSGPDRAD